MRNGPVSIFCHSGPFNSFLWAISAGIKRTLLHCSAIMEITSAIKKLLVQLRVLIALRCKQIYLIRILNLSETAYFFLNSQFLHRQLHNNLVSWIHDNGHAAVWSSAEVVNMCSWSCCSSRSRRSSIISRDVRNSTFDEAVAIVSLVTWESSMYTVFLNSCFRLLSSGTTTSILPFTCDK